MENILITGARAPVALEMATSFAKMGCKVIMADFLWFGVARWSKAVQRFYTLPAPRFHIDKYITKLQYIIEKEQITHLIPICEEAFYIALHQEKLACKVWTSTQTLMYKLHHKYLFSQVFQDHLPTPHTVLVRDFEDWENTENYVFKPIFSRFAMQIFIGKKVKKSFFKPAMLTEWIAQKRVVGKEVCVYSIWEAGKLKAYSAYQPLYRVGKGSALFFEPIQQERIYQLVAEFGKAIHYIGQLSFDVIVDEAGKAYFIECNPRGTSGAHLLSEHLAEAFLSNHFCNMRYTQAFTIKSLLLIYKPFLLFSPIFYKAKDVIYRQNDLKPFFFQYLSIFEMLFTKFWRNVSWTRATMYDIEWNGEGFETDL